MQAAFVRHDHDRCIASTVAMAARTCAQRGVQFTEVRRRVLELLLERHRAIGAYDILDRLRAEGRAAQPPVAYRALEFLVSQGFAHRIESLNAFAACARPGADHAPAFLICRVCNAVAEAEAGPGRAVGRALGRAARDQGFTIEQTVVEAEGVCPNCADRPDRADSPAP